MKVKQSRDVDDYFGLLIPKFLHFSSWPSEMPWSLFSFDLTLALACGVCARPYANAKVCY
jgi:hypothetical protein